MGKTKGTPAPKREYDWRSYPEPLEQRSGCKVSWLYYDSREEAETAARAAVHNARISESLGYDFGYCSPGSIDPVPESTVDVRKGKWEVCIP